VKNFVEIIKDVICHQPEYLDESDLGFFGNGIGIIEYKPEDNVRSGDSRAFAKLYHFRNP
jgi:RNA binding exosome subunit